MDPVAYALMRSGLFSSLAPEAFGALLRDVERVEVAGGDIVVRAGESADAFYVIVSGAVHVFIHAADGAEVALAELRPGDHFGEQALLAGRVRNASVRGLAPHSLLARVGVDQLDALCANAPGLRHELEALGQRQVQEQLSRGTDLVRSLLATLEARAETLDRENGDVLFRQGDPTGAAYVVLAGAVEVFEEREGASVRVASAGPGVCVGERDEVTRRLTAVVDGTTRLLKVPRDALALAAGSGKARDHLATLQKVWELPQRGFVTHYLGSVDGAACLTQLFHLADGRSFVSSHVIGSEAVRLQASAGTTARVLTTPDEAIRVEVESDGRIVRIDAQASRPLLAAAFARAIEGRPLLPAEEATLTRTGALAADDEGIACACMRVTRARVRLALAEGVADLEALSQRTGCGMSCGSCIPGLLELLGKASFLPVVVARRVVLAPGVVRVFLSGRSGEALPVSRPGQHVVLRATINGQVVDRPYTLSGAPGAPWEVTVKREPTGRFSVWLCDVAQPGTALEASAPRGTYVWDEGPAPVVCLTSGIGVTPALCFARTVIRRGLPHRVLIDWSTRHEADAAVLGELSEAACANLTIRPRYTSRAGRITRADVHALARRFPTAAFFLCGSEGYMTAVSEALAAAGVPAARVHVEHFDAAGVAAAVAAPEGVA